MDDDRPCLPLLSIKNCLSPSSPMILVRNLSSYNVITPGLLEWLIQIKSNRDLPAVGPSVGELVLGWGLADSSDDILLEKKNKILYL